MANSFNPELFHEKYRIKSARAEWWEYYEGIYHIVICTHKREHYFGEITCHSGHNEMHLTEIGKFVDDEIPKIMDHYWYAYVPQWAVMPNHIHILILIDRRGRDDVKMRDDVETRGPHVSTSSRDHDSTESRDHVSTESRDHDSTESRDHVSTESRDHVSTESRDHVSTESRDHVSTESRDPHVTTSHAPHPRNEFMSSITPKTGSISVVINQFKRAITMYARSHQIPFQWQSRFYDKILFDQIGFDRTYRYIANNVAKWHCDRQNTMPDWDETE